MPRSHGGDRPGFSLLSAEVAGLRETGQQSLFHTDTLGSGRAKVTPAGGLLLALHKAQFPHFLRTAQTEGSQGPKLPSTAWPGHPQKKRQQGADPAGGMKCHRVQPCSPRQAAACGGTDPGTDIQGEGREKIRDWRLPQRAKLSEAVGKAETLGSLLTCSRRYLAPVTDGCCKEYRRVRDPRLVSCRKSLLEKNK